MKQRWGVLGFFAVSLLVLIAALAYRWFASGMPDPWGDKPRPRVVVTIPPLACFVRNVGGPNITLVCLSTDQGPADLEPTEGDVALVAHADLFLSSGLGVDDQLADDLLKRANPRRSRKLAEELPAGLGSNQNDPRVWLGVSRAVVLVQRIRDELSAVDPSQSDLFERNATRYVEHLRRLEAEAKKTTAMKESARFVSLSGPLHHFAKSFGLEQAGMADPTDVQAVVALCEADEGLRVLVGPPGFGKSAQALKLAEALRQKKVLADLAEVDIMQTASVDELGQPDWYSKRMLDNFSRILKLLP